jgi:hypothetical protein
MAHPKDDELIPLQTIVRIKEGSCKGKRARIKQHSFRFEGQYFQHYLGYIEGRGKGLYVLYHDDLEIISLPNEQNEEPSNS